MQAVTPGPAPEHPDSYFANSGVQGLVPLRHGHFFTMFVFNISESRFREQLSKSLSYIGVHASSDHLLI